MEVRPGGSPVRRRQGGCPVRPRDLEHERAQPPHPPLHAKHRPHHRRQPRHRRAGHGNERPDYGMDDGCLRHAPRLHAGHRHRQAGSAGRLAGPGVGHRSRRRHGARRAMSRAGPGAGDDFYRYPWVWQCRFLGSPLRLRRRLPHPGGQRHFGCDLQRGRARHRCPGAPPERKRRVEGVRRRRLDYE